MCRKHAPRIKDIHATAKLILYLAELRKALLHLLVQLQGAEATSDTAGVSPISGGTSRSKSD